MGVILHFFSLFFFHPVFLFVVLLPFTLISLEDSTRYTKRYFHHTIYYRKVAFPFGTSVNRCLVVTSKLHLPLYLLIHMNGTLFLHSMALCENVLTKSKYVSKILFLRMRLICLQTNVQVYHPGMIK